MRHSFWPQLILLVIALIITVALYTYLKRLARTPVPRVEESSPSPVIGTISVERMKADVQALAGEIGARKSGTAQEAAAAQYIAKALAVLGEVNTEGVPLPNGRRSANVWATLPGDSPRIMLIGAHMDSKVPSPGANDNASGVAVLLELARVLKDARPAYTVRFVAFGAEEIIDRHRDHHHYGSRLMAADPALRRQLHCMTSLDMVGVGTKLHIENLERAPNGWRDRLSVIAKGQGLPVRCGRGRPHSDFEAFERAGISAAYLHWERDPAYHTRRDLPANISGARLRQTAEVMLDAILHAGTP